MSESDGTMGHTPGAWSLSSCVFLSPCLFLIPRHPGTQASATLCLGDNGSSQPSRYISLSASTLCRAWCRYREGGSCAYLWCHRAGRGDNCPAWADTAWCIRWVTWQGSLAHLNLGTECVTAQRLGELAVEVVGGLPTMRGGRGEWEGETDFPHPGRGLAFSPCIGPCKLCS